MSSDPLDQPPQVYRRASNGLPLSGWCSECGSFLHRFATTEPVLNADGSSHSHSNPWDLGPKPEAST